MAAAEGSATTATTIEDLHPDVLTRVLRRLDGPALATASCATTHLRGLTTQPDIWEHLCLSAWPSLRHPVLLRLLPSFPDSHRSFFSDSYPFLHPGPKLAVDDAADPTTGDVGPPAQLISAVDLFHKGKLVFSRVLETKTLTPWFLCSPFRVDAFERKDPPPQEALLSPEDLTLSWIVIDPVRRRAANLSSRRPVSVERRWYTGEIQVRFATVLGEGESAATATVVVTCGEELMSTREVSLTVEDVDGMCLNGRDSLVILKGALEGLRRGKGEEGEGEARRRYSEYVESKRERKEEKTRREGRLDMFCTIFGVSVFLAFLAFLVFR